MLCDYIAYLFACIDTVILANDGEEAAIGVFIIVEFAIDSLQPLAVIFHNRF